MLLLAIDTSTSAIAVALHDGDRVLAESVTLDARRHTEHVAPGIETVLAEAGAEPGDVTAVAVGVGPGPFTGLRVGMVTGTVFAHTRGIPVHGVCSLDALALDASLRCSAGPEFVVATDARRREVYWARYAADAGRPRRVTDPAVDYPATVAGALEGRAVVGRGGVLYPDLLTPSCGPLDVRAGAVAELALAGETMPVEPLYLRRPDAMPTAARKSTLQGRP